MKIMQITYALASGGAERFIISLSKSLVNQGHEVEVCMLLDDNEPSRIFNKPFLDNRVKYHNMHFTSGFSLQKARKLEQYIRKQNPDVVHCHLNVIPYIYGLALLKYRKIRFVHTLHNVAQHAAGLRVQYYLNRFFYRHDIIRPVTISKLCQESYQNYYRLNNAVSIDNGCACVKLSDSYEDVKQQIQLLKNGEKKPVFIHVARFHSQKNQVVLIDAFNKLNQDGIDYILLILGADFDCSAAQHLVEKSCSKIHYIGETSNVGDYLCCSDAFCLTSIYEGLPISLLEALSAGVTPICTAVGGIPDVVTDGVTGYLSESVSVESYVNTLKRFLSKPMDSNVLKKHFEENYSMDVCAEKYVKVYQKK